MARRRFWRRNMNISGTWPKGTQGNQHLMYALEGETLIRTLLDVRFWARTTDQGTSIPPDRLYCPYAFGLFWNDGTVPNPSQVYPLQHADDYPDNWLYLERFDMRDAYTPAKYTGVNIGFQDQRPSQQVESHAQRLGRRAEPAADELIFAWQGFSTVYGDALVVEAKVSVSCLFLAPA